MFLRLKYYIIFSFCFLLLNNGCKKPEEVGLEVLPSFDLLKTPFSDTATIQSFTLKEDSLRGSQLSRMLLGSMVDPIFGLSQASIYTQVLLGNTPSLGTNLTGDSLVLSLAYSGYYGDTSQQQTLHLYLLNDSTINSDSTYYTNRTFSYGPDFITPIQFTPHPTDSVLVGTANQGAQLRISLGVAEANDFILHLQQSQFQTNAGWLTYFKGVYLKTDASGSGGAILYFDPSNIYTKMTLYYHDTSNVSTSYDFALSGARINHQEHDYTGSAVATALADSSFLNSDTLNYLQSMAGLRVKLKFPYLKHFTDSGSILVNKAELVITTPAADTTAYAPPATILLTAFDSTGAIKFLPDYFESNFGGTYIGTSLVYKFNIAREVQQILDGKLSDNIFSLNVLSSAVQANRVVIGSGKSVGSKMKLRLFYTRLPQSIKRQSTNGVKAPSSKPKS